MKKEDYKIDFEENRKEISLEESDVLPSRIEKYGRNRKTKKKSGNLTINVILGLFTLIPVVILIYVISDFYSPKTVTTANVENDKQEVILQKDDKNSSDGTDKGIVEDEDDEKSQDTGVASEKTKDTASTPTKKPAINVSPPADKTKETVKKPEVKPEVKPEKKPTITKPVTTPKPAAKTHTVGTNENLYRIALKYYGSGSEASIEKIRRANGLASNEISVGQNLIIP